ncbi:MAG: gamma-glutamyl-gamma-aminobutyrate hydrolase family protein [Ruminococcaceae bacterium]|nr:gamma-glutamyl-gamma-aminobutyrate hydrolase family protein [Oscillospiraceae bacterium]
MKKPLIGITLNHREDTYFTIRGNYIDSIIRAGGVPVPLCYDENNTELPEIVELLNGILFSGGEDVNPKYYGEETQEACGKICDDRDEFELKLYKYAVSKNLPILGICRGIQLINVAAAGTLIQDIPSFTAEKIPLDKHKQQPPYENFAHSSNVIEKTYFSELFGKDKISTNSMHHQAVKDLAPGFKAGVISDNGIIEAIYSENHNFIVGVQWHPEFLWDKGGETEKLFEAFIKASSK